MTVLSAKRLAPLGFPGVLAMSFGFLLASPHCARGEAPAAAAAATDTAAATTTAPSAAAATVTPAAAPAEDIWAFHVQSTFTEQYHPEYPSPYQGGNSMPPHDEGKETFDATLFGGLHPWQGGEFWLNPEVDQGFGLGNTLGAAGFTSGEAYKVGNASPYLRLPRAFYRQTLDFGGDTQATAADLNQFALPHTANRVVITAGKFSVVDIFDNNQYAHDPRNDFLNWSLIDIGSFDYAADAWGFTEGASLEGYWGRFAARTGFFAMSPVPNSKTIDTNFNEFQVPVELEEDHSLLGRPGKLRALAFLTRAKMTPYDDATNVALATGGTPDLAALRGNYHTKTGVGLNLEQQIADNLGFFARAGVSQGKYEAFDFTDINQTVSAGLSFQGAAWSRPQDTAGLGFAVNGASSAAKLYFAEGGLGILVGDGQLPDPAAEKIAEAYYSYALTTAVKVTADYQFLDDPGYNAQRGPISVFGLRGHLQF